MTLNTAGLVTAANAVDAQINFLQAHSGNPTTAGTANAIGSRVAVNGTVDTNGKITWSDVSFIGLGASVAFWGVSYWTAASGGTCLGIQARTTGDAATNTAGSYTWSGTETPAAT